ncbi:MAG: hypothetical protein P4L69_13860 [Desulfosporosinus sp.]|nr:hypothetical protein [Desulfosporosinus sp.]
MKKTLQIELDLFFETIKGVENGISKQGYSEARQKISPTAFIKLADATMPWHYGDDDYYSAEHANGLSFFVVPRRFQVPSRNDKFRRI